MGARCFSEGMPGLYPLRRLGRGRGLVKPPLPAVPFDCAQPFSNELGVIAIPGSTANYRVSPRES